MEDTPQPEHVTVRGNTDEPVELAPGELDAIAAGFAGSFDEVIITFRKDSGNSTDRNGSQPTPFGVTRTS